MKKLLLLFSLISTIVYSQPVLTGRQGGTGVANTNKTITLGSSLSWPANGSGVLNNDGSGNLSWSAASGGTWGSITGTLTNQTDLKNFFIPIAGTYSTYPLYGPIEFSVGTTALWQNSSTGSGYYIGSGNNSDLNAASKFSLIYFNPNGNVFLRSNDSTTSTKLLLTQTSTSVSATSTSYQGIVYGASTATNVAANQTGTTLLHRDAGDARWLSSSYSVAPTSVTSPITLTSNTLALTSTGTGSVVLSSGATVSTPTITSAVLTGTATALGTPASGTLTNCTGLPVAGTLLSVSAPLTLTTNTLAVTTVGSGSVALQGALTSYTPTWTSAGTPPSAGNATVTAQYIKTGRVVNVWIFYQTGSTTTFGSANAWTFSLPSTASSVNNILGEAYGFNYLVSNYTGVCYGASTTTFYIVSHLNGSSWLSTAPGTWGGAGNSFFKFHVTYTE